MNTEQPTISYASMIKQYDKAQCNVPGVPQYPIFTDDFSFNTGQEMTLHSYDYVTFVALLVTSTLIGIFAAWKSKTNLSLDDYLMAGRNENVFVAGFSRASTYISSVFILSVPTEIYFYSTNFIWFGFTFILIHVIAAECYIPVYYRLRLTSLYEYLELRFCRGIRTVASAMFILHSMCYSAPVLMLPSLALNKVAGFDLWTSILAVTIVTVLYSTVGGTKAVLWTDAFQMCIMIIGMLVIAIRIYTRVGSFQDAFNSADRTNRLKLFDLSLDLTKHNTMFSLLIGGCVNTLPLFAANHTTVHRCLICKTWRRAKQAICLNVIIRIYATCFIVYVGIYMGYLYENCDPIKAGIVNKRSDLTVLFMMDVTKGATGLMGVFMAFLFSASLSTVSSAINSASTVFLEDFIRRYFSPNIRHKRAKLISQLLCIFFGLITLELTHIFVFIDGMLPVVMLIISCFSIPVLGCFSLGLFFPQANYKGAYSTLFTGFFVQISYLVGRQSSVTLKNEIIPPMCVSNCNISVLSNATIFKLRNPPSPRTTNPEPSYFFSLEYYWISFFTFIICLSAGVLVSYITGFQNTKDLDANLTVPLADVVFPFYYLPEWFRARLRCGVKYTDQWKRVPPAHIWAKNTEVIDAANQPSTLIGENGTEAVNNNDISSGSTVF